MLTALSSSSTMLMRCDHRCLLLLRVTPGTLPGRKKWNCFNR